MVRAGIVCIRVAFLLHGNIRLSVKQLPLAILGEDVHSYFVVLSHA